MGVYQKVDSSPVQGSTGLTPTYGSLEEGERKVRSSSFHELELDNNKQKSFGIAYTPGSKILQAGFNNS